MSQKRRGSRPRNLEDKNYTKKIIALAIVARDGIVDLEGFADEISRRPEFRIQTKHIKKVSLEYLRRLKKENDIKHIGHGRSGRYAITPHGYEKAKYFKENNRLPNDLLDEELTHPDTL